MEAAVILAHPPLRITILGELLGKRLVKRSFG
jgi:hypothetical protein